MLVVDVMLSNTTPLRYTQVHPRATPTIFSDRENTHGPTIVAYSWTVVLVAAALTPNVVPVVNPAGLTPNAGFPSHSKGSPVCLWLPTVPSNGSGTNRVVSSGTR